MYFRFFAVCLAFFAAFKLSAAPIGAGAKGYGLSFEQVFEYADESDIGTGGTGGGLTIWRSESHLVYQSPWADGLMELGGFYDYSDYDFDGSTAPVTVGQSLGLEFTYLQHIMKEWSLFTMNRIEFSADEDASFGDGFSYNAVLGATYQWSPSFALSFGLYYQSGLEDDDILLPVIALDWQVNDQLRIRTANGVFVTYDLYGDGQTILEISGEYQHRHYALISDANGKRSVKEHGGAVGIGVKHYITKELYVKGYVDYLFEREFEVMQDDTQLSHLDIEDGFAVGIAGGMVW